MYSEILLDLTDLNIEDSFDFESSEDNCPFIKKKIICQGKFL